LLAVGGGSTESSASGVLQLGRGSDGDYGAGVGVSAVTEGDQRPGLVATRAEALDDREVDQTGGMARVTVRR
jgi:hypothetical protein